MEAIKRYRVVTRLGAGFFTNVAAGYLFAIFVSPTPWSLTNNVAFCILSLYAVYVLSSLSKMNNIADILTRAQIATALAIIAFAVLVKLLHGELHKHK
jgi:hypothetical protein